MSDIKVEESGMIPIYTGLFLIKPTVQLDENDEESALFHISKFHVTYHYQPGDPHFPTHVCENDWSEIAHMGIYDDGEVLASRVSIINHNRNNPNENRSSIKKYQPRRILDNGDSVTGLPLHITWDVKPGISPVVSGERLSDIDNIGYDSKYFKYYTPVEDSINYNKKVSESMNANDLNKDDNDDKDTYLKRINPIFSYMNTMGIWKKYMAEPK